MQKLHTPISGFFSVLALSGLAIFPLRADVKMPSIFGDHMVLQEGIDLPVWGKASPGEVVTVTVGEQKAEATADAQGAWMVKLNPLPASGQPVDLQVTGSNSLVFHDVLAGDVWLCSGQSNMVFGLGNASNASEAIPQANYPGIRLFMVGDQAPRQPATNCKGQWRVCTPDNVKIGGWNGFSAVGYFFGRELYEKEQKPIGLIQTAFNGTPIEAWTSLEALQSNPTVAHYAADFIHMRDFHDQLKQEFINTVLPGWQRADDAWQQKYGGAYAEALKQWQAQADTATQNGEPAPPKPKPEEPEPKRPYFVGDSESQPSVLYDGMINPLIPYGIKGAIWYQGEGNANTRERAAEYAALLPLMINDWRQRWGKEVPALAQFPFVYVQLASYGYGWLFPVVRNAELKTLSLPNTGMAVALDVGNEQSIHPTDKLTVGHRLALAARHAAYGENLVYSGPIYDSMKVEGSKMRIRFTGIGSGLMIGAAPPDSPSAPPAAPESALQGFSIAGSDGKFGPAQAAIDGNAVLVWNAHIPQPTAVRYGWAGFPKPPVNLYNKEGLPASPFATDIRP